LNTKGIDAKKEKSIKNRIVQRNALILNILRRFFLIPNRLKGLRIS